MSELSKEQKSELKDFIIKKFRDLYGFQDENENELFELDLQSFDLDPCHFLEDCFMALLGGEFPDEYPEGNLGDILNWFEENWDGETMDEDFIEEDFEEDF